MVSRPVQILFGASSSFIIISLLTWRARKRAQSAVDRAEEMVAEGPMVKYEDDFLRERILKIAIRRAAKWMSYQVSGANQMVGQIGGLSAHKRPLLTFTDHVLKPLQVDHRGIREIAFYEAVKMAAHLGPYGYGAFGSTRNSSSSTNFVDVLAFSLALWLKDSFVVDCQKRILRSWRTISAETKLLSKLHTFVPNYFGVVKHQTSVPPSLPEEKRSDVYGISLDSYLLLQDLTANFSKP